MVSFNENVLDEGWQSVMQVLAGESASDSSGSEFPCEVKTRIASLAPLVQDDLNLPSGLRLKVLDGMPSSLLPEVAANAVPHALD